MSHRPRKRFGQNFLQNPSIIAQIVASINLNASDNVLEIGPGMGAMTQALLKQLPRLTAIEIDRDLCALLKETYPAEQLLLISCDALTVDYEAFGPNLRVVGNLPYNISTPLLIHLFNFVSSIKDMHFMLQKEVVERLVAAPGSKDYGRLSIITQYYCQTDYLFEVPPEAFFPKPKVDSAIVRLTPYTSSPYPEVDISRFQNLVAKAFSMRRKTLANNLKPLLSAHDLIQLGVDPTQRPEQVSIREYIEISKHLDMM
ncbi:dimethyladenosine transferase (16S rRNA dimethylase) [Legionella birminghamensis]|uniref:Ribosomal RNA small subunit methyltransferase A n=1 Tax=Legionella birminghamensis TaxID=28083 RepID=A0A378I536_9GAMM|nr:16S rRNA (adenine(1518)-N(6)/adenine(1519)-N(6))-dimethyltransferase RsmA [Legionella birminghamensis]KTC68706.1 dimethyladenosine transferase (16S rRNA dimethylase) [Legionella birminghamensis]STX30308.1 dimethyladenosine transferase (16S rRNA dimethylase) [Legionella birminghamensis]